MEDNELLRHYKIEQAKKAIEIFKCNVCLDRVSKPLRFCKGGHLICKVCQYALQDCPVCHRSFSKDINIALEQTLEISIFPCKNEIFGCQTIGLYDEINKHEHFNCDYKKFQCFLFTQGEETSICGKDVTIYDFKDHIKNEHLDRRKISYKSELKSDLFIDTNDALHLIKPIEVVKDEENPENSIFFLEYLSYDCDNETLFIAYHYVGLIKDAAKYKYFVMIKDKQSSTVITCQNRCLPVEIGGRDDELKSRKCVGIDISTFNSSNDRDRDDKYLIVSVVLDNFENEVKWDFGGKKRSLTENDCILVEENKNAHDHKSKQPRRK